MLREIRTFAAKSFKTLLFARLPASPGARSSAAAALEKGAGVSPEILIGTRGWLYIQPDGCSWNFINSIVPGDMPGRATPTGNVDC
jgi:hypothetical protein